MRTLPFIILIFFSCGPFYILCQDLCDIKILGKYYNISTLTTMTGRYPERVAFAGGKMLYFTEGATYSINEKGVSENEYSLTIPEVNELNGQMMGTFEVIEYDDNDRAISKIVVQSNGLRSDNNLVRIFACGENYCIIDLKGSVGTFYALRKDNIYIAGKLVAAQRINQVGDNVASLAFDSSSENILIGKGTKEAGSIVLLKRMNDTSCFVETPDPAMPNMVNIQQSVNAIVDSTKNSISKLLDKPSKPVTTEKEKELTATIEELKAELDKLNEEYPAFVESLQADVSNVAVEGKYGRSRRTTSDKACIPEKEFKEYDKKIRANLLNITEHFSNIGSTLMDMNVKVLVEETATDYNAIDVRFSPDTVLSNDCSLML